MTDADRIAKVLNFLRTAELFIEAERDQDGRLTFTAENTATFLDGMKRSQATLMEAEAAKNIVPAGQ